MNLLKGLLTFICTCRFSASVSNLLCSVVMRLSLRPSLAPLSLITNFFHNAIFGDGAVYRPVLHLDTVLVCRSYGPAARSVIPLKFSKSKHSTSITQSSIERSTLAPNSTRDWHVRHVKRGLIASSRTRHSLEKTES